MADVKEKFDITLNNSALSTIKGKIKNSGATPSKKPGRLAASSNGAVAHKPISAVSPGKTTHTHAKLAQAVKELVVQHGAEMVKAIADVFAK